MSISTANISQHGLSLGSLGHYIQWVQKLPFLTEEEERDLATRLFEKNDLEAARQLILSHLRLVVSIARGYDGYGLPQADLIQEGNIGLMKAVRRFNPSVGVRLVSFAVHWIRAEIHEFILKNWRIVKIATTKAQRKLFFNLRKASKKLGWLSDDEAQEVAKTLNVSVKDVQQMHYRLNTPDESLDPPVGDEEANMAWFAPIHQIEDQRYNPALENESKDWELAQESKLQQALATLDARSQEIIQLRWLNEAKSTLQELAAKYQVSAERIRQLEKQAFAKLKTNLCAN